MLLSDLRLSDMPFSALVTLKRAINEELHERRKRHFVERKLEHFASIQRAPIFENLSIEDSFPSHCRAIPESARTQDAGFSRRYLVPLLCQDWDFLFPDADDTLKTFYVYAHIDPRKKIVTLDPWKIILPGTPFYIGKGTGNRAFDLKRNDGHRKILSEIRASGFPDTIVPHILRDRLTEKKALIIEAKLIYFFGSLYANAVRKGCLINLADHIRPKFDREMTVIKNPGHPRKRNDDSPIVSLE